MAIVRNDLSISSIDARAVVPVVDDLTTPIGVKAELRGAAVAITTATCTVRYGSVTVSLATVVAVTGEATASLTSTNIDTLGAGILSTLTALWVITVTDGSGTQTGQFEQPLIVSDRLLRWSVLYADLKAQFPQLRLSAAVPTDQTNLWPQCVIALRKLETSLRLEHGALALSRVVSTEPLKEVAELSCLIEMGLFLNMTDNGQSGIGVQVKDWKAELATWMSILTVSIKDSAAWGTTGTQQTVPLEVAKPAGWQGQYQGGGVL